MRFSKGLLWVLAGKLLLAGGAMLLGAALADIVHGLRGGLAPAPVSAWLALAAGALGVRYGWRLDARFDRGRGTRAF